MILLLTNIFGFLFVIGIISEVAMPIYKGNPILPSLRNISIKNNISSLQKEKELVNLLREEEKIFNEIIEGDNNV